MTQSTTTLANIPMFSQLDEQALSVLSKSAMNRSFTKNKVLIKEGELSDSLYIIFSGRLQAYLSDDNGKEVILSTMGPGEYFGEIALLDDTPRTASIMVIEDCELSIISRSMFETILTTHSSLALAMLKGMAQRLVHLTKNVKNLALMDVYGRIAHFLLNAAKEENGLLATEKLTHQDIANQVGSSREMVSRILKDLKIGGYIEIEDKKIIIQKSLPPEW